MKTYWDQVGSVFLFLCISAMIILSAFAVLFGPYIVGGIVYDNTGRRNLAYGWMWALYAVEVALACLLIPIFVRPA